MSPRLFLVPLLALLAVSQHVSAIVDRPASTSVPGISSKDMPQMILFTHDDNTDKDSAKYVLDITNKHRNKNGCLINAAFFTTTSESDCATVKKMYNMGHEIGEHTVRHEDLHEMSAAEKKKEIVGARNWIIKCGIPSKDVVGHRSPFLSDDAEVRKILNDNGYLYDASIGEFYDSKTSPSANKRLLPYSLNKGIAQIESCNYFDNINHCTSSEKHKNLYELPMWMYQSSPGTPAGNDLMDPPNAYPVLKRELERNYAGNRAPVGIWVHSTTTGYLDQASNRAQINKFLSWALKKPDVWVVTPRQLIDWMQNPVPASQMASFMSKYKCSK